VCRRRLIVRHTCPFARIRLNARFVSHDQLRRRHVRSDGARNDCVVVSLLEVLVARVRERFVGGDIVHHEMNEIDRTGPASSVRSGVTRRSILKVSNHVESLSVRAKRILIPLRRRVVRKECVVPGSVRDPHVCQLGIRVERDAQRLDRLSNDRPLLRQYRRIGRIAQVLPVEVHTVTTVILQQPYDDAYERRNLVVRDRSLQIAPATERPNELTTRTFAPRHELRNLEALPFVRVRPCRIGHCHHGLDVRTSHRLVQSASVPTDVSRRVGIRGRVERQKRVEDRRVRLEKRRVHGRVTGRPVFHVTVHQRRDG